MGRLRLNLALSLEMPLVDATRVFAALEAVDMRKGYDGYD